VDTREHKPDTVTISPLMQTFFFFAGGPGHLVQIHGNMDSSKYQQIKN